MQVIDVPIASLMPDPSNARKHSLKNLDAIKGSLAKFGQQKPIVVDANNVVIAGNGTLAAAQSLGWEQINVVRTELTGSEAIAFALSDNRSSELAEWDDDILGKTLHALREENFDLTNIGFDTSYLDNILTDSPAEAIEAYSEVEEDDELPDDSSDAYVAKEYVHAPGNLINADCLDALPKLEADSVDALVTDPPAGIAFMGKAWDEDKGGRDEWVAWMGKVMRECHRVLKPGAHGLVWAIPRTSHWTATALENAGFEVRDVVTHLFGSGFPKSLDISKAIDKAAGANGESIGVSSNSRPNSERGNGLAHGEYGKVWDDTKASTDAAKQWQGWGTALKPASEHWILVRKPCAENTVAANVLEWGCGGINIDASRVVASKDDIGDLNRFKNAGAASFIPIREIRERLARGEEAHNGENLAKCLDRAIKDGESAVNTMAKTAALGRFPSNLILDEEAAALLDEQSGVLKNGGQNKTSHRETWLRQETEPTKFAGDIGGASRFFYVAKASKSERNAGLDDVEAKEVQRHGDRAPDVGRQPQKALLVKNHHPTVKPQKLMQYLIKLITPAGGTVLDPFMGSGSTGVAAQNLGYQFIGIEKEAEYFEIAKTRLTSEG